MKTSEPAEAISEKLRSAKNPQDRLATLIQFARETPSLPAEHKTDAFKLEGCLSNLWLVCEAREGRCFFRADSDSAIVKGLAVLICQLHSGLPPGEVPRVDTDLLRETGVWRQLTPNRRTGISRLIEKIHTFAKAQPQ